MSNRIAFQTQLASIMEVLANAAVAEICKLVDDDYAIVNLQMSQCQRENKALKRKLHLLELKMARGLAERRIGSLGRANRVHVSAEKYRNQTNEVLYGAQLWRGGGTNVTPAHIMKENDSLGGDAAVSETDTVLIKEEIFEEEQTQDRLLSRNDEVTEIVSQTGEAGFGDVQMVNDEEQVSGMQTLEVSVSDTAVKSEPKFESVKGISHKPLELHAEAKFDLNGKSSPVREFLTQERNNADLRQQSCAYVNDASSTESRSSDLVPHSDIIEVDSAEEGEEVPVWVSKVAQGKNHATGVYPHYRREDLQNSRSFLPSSNLLLAPSDFAAVASTSSKIQGMDSFQNTQDVSLYQQRAGRTKNDGVSHEKLFSCTYCGKAFNRPKKVVIHQRIHTGEKPFKCNTCGKFFAEAGNLKKHQKVHTGERPYSCAHCGKTFAWIRNLKTHQQKYHPDIFTAEDLLSLGGLNH